MGVYYGILLSFLKFYTPIYRRNMVKQAIKLGGYLIVQQIQMQGFQQYTSSFTNAEIRDARTTCTMVNRCEQHEGFT